MSINLGHWVTSLPIELQQTPFGFVYEITNLKTGKKYIGKKQCLTVRKQPPLKGKKNKRHKTVETDWKEYTSSCNELNDDILVYGKDNFKFEIIRWCNGKAEMAYYEAKLQFDRDALLREDYYNGIVNLRISRFKPSEYSININNDKDNEI